MNAKPSVSIALSFFNDFDFLEQALERVAPFADEIVMLDGPFSYAIPLLDALGLLYDKPPEPLKALISKYNIRYQYDQFSDEGQKRVQLYHMCSKDIVMLFDADELITAFDAEALQSFWQSGRKAGSALLYNLAGGTHVMGRPSMKHIFFRRESVDAADHLNYTWLVGVEQKPINADDIFPTHICDIAHMTLCRSEHGNAVKFAFYRSMHLKHEGVPARLGNWPIQDLLANNIPQESLRRYFVWSNPGSLNIPAKDTAYLRYAVPKLPTIAHMMTLAHPLPAGTGRPYLTGVRACHPIRLPDRYRTGEVISLSIEVGQHEAIQAHYFLRLKSEKLEGDVKIEEKTPLAGGARVRIDLSFSLPCHSHAVENALLILNLQAKTPIEDQSTGLFVKQSVVINAGKQSRNIAKSLSSNPDFTQKYTSTVAEEAGGLTALYRKAGVIIMTPSVALEKENRALDGRFRDSSTIILLDQGDTEFKDHKGGFGFDSTVNQLKDNENMVFMPIDLSGEESVADLVSALNNVVTS